MRIRFFTIAILTALLISKLFAQECSILAQQDPIPLEIPHFLKTDSLGLVEKWTIGNLQFHPNHVLKIYDRRGKLVFQSKRYENNWPSAQYIDNRFLFILDIEDKRINGWVEIEKKESY